MDEEEEKGTFNQPEEENCAAAERKQPVEGGAAWCVSADLTSSSFLLRTEPMLEKAAVAFRLAWDSVSDVRLYLPEKGERRGHGEAPAAAAAAWVGGWEGGAYAVEVVTSCQVLEMFCLSSFSGVMPSFLLMSASCFSLAARTWDRVWISSSTWTHAHTQRSFFWL